MKTFKNLINEVAQPRSPDERRFKDKHEIEVWNSPSPFDHQFSGKFDPVNNQRIADYTSGEDEAVYEENINESDKDKYYWKDINNALMSVGMRPAQILKVLSALSKKEVKESNLDKVNKKAASKDFDDRKDKDIDNDGDVDDSDEYLHKRRKAISKNMKKESHLGEAESTKMSAVKRAIHRLAEAKMSDSEILSAAKKLASNGKDAKAKKFGQGLVDFYEKNKSFTPDQVAGLQNIMKNASFQLAKEDASHFITKAAAAKSKDKKKFKLGDDEYPVTIKDKNAKKVVDEAVSVSPKGSKTATSYDSYEDYVKDAKKKGVQVIPKKLWTNLKNDSLDEVSFDLAKRVRDRGFDKMVKSAGSTRKNKYGNNEYVPATDDEMKDAEKGARQAKRASSAMRRAHNKKKTGRYESVQLDEAFKAGSMELDDGSTVKLSKQDADLLNDMFSDLNAKNKKEMQKVVKTDKAGFEEILGFAREAL